MSATTTNPIATTSHGTQARCRVGPIDVRAPTIKKRMIKGRMMPNFRRVGFNFSDKRRQICIDIMAPAVVDPEMQATADRSTIIADFDPENEVLNEDDQVKFRIFRLSKRGSSAKQDDDEEDSDDDDDEDSVMTEDTDDDDDDGNGSSKVWRQSRSYPSDAVELLRLHHNKVLEMQLGVANRTVIRDFKFETDEEAVQFQTALERIKELENERAQRRIAKYKQKHPQTPTNKSRAAGAAAAAFDDMPQSPRGISNNIPEEQNQYADEDMINLLVEIVSATDVPVADIASTDTYVKVQMGGKEIHKTKVINSDLNPIWSLETDSLFLVQMTPEDFFASTSGMTFTVKDYDSMSASDLIGTVNVKLDELLKGMGDRMGYDIVLDKHGPKAKKGTTPKLFLRYKKASDDDIEFMNAYKERAKKFGVYADETFLPFRKQNTKFMKRQTKRSATSQDQMFRVRPGPDPNREEETKWMTEAQINAEAEKPSTSWIEAGSGELGKLYCEIIGCDGLPNMDAQTLNMRDKTDAFCCLVYEDCIVNTDVIGDSLSPRWMPWCQRSFVMHIAHPASDLLLGVFDHDPELSPLQMASKATSTVHDEIGRVVVNLSSFCPNTLYTLTYPLHYGELEEHRSKDRGTVTIRLRLEYPNARKVVLAGMMPPDQQVVSVARKIDYEVAHYTSEGIVDDNRFSLTTLTRYIEELESYDVLGAIINYAIMSVWLWRPHFPVKMFGKSFMLPLHSLTAWLWGICVTWNYNLFPSFLLFSVGWLLLACNEMVKQHPSPFHKGPSYYDLLSRLAFGKGASETIAANTMAAESKAYNEKIERLRVRRKEERQKEYDHEDMLYYKLEAEAQKAEAEEQMGGQGGIFAKMNLLKPILYPIQRLLRDIIRFARITKSILLWHEAYFAFWLVTASFASAIVALFVPWGFILRWTLRIAVFLALGPWMRLVDKHLLKTNFDMTEQERDTAFKQKLAARYQEVVESATHLFLRKERALKLKSMKKYMFGQYLVKVPRFREEIFEDYPLPLSSAVEINPDSLEPVRIGGRKYGQNLTGDMIPQREIQVAHSATEAAPKKKRKFGGFLRRRRKNKETTPLLSSEDEAGYSAISA